VIDTKFSYPEVGEVRFRTSRRARRINITVKNSHHVRVTIPIGVSLAVARKFFAEHISWVSAALMRIRKSEKEQIISNGYRIQIRNQPFVLNIKNSSVFTFARASDEIFISYPENYKVSDAEVQDFIKKGVIKILQDEAKHYLPGRLAVLARQFGFKYNKVSIKNQKTRWGSCSSKNNINLNLQLLRLSDVLIDYIILHELLHTRIKNHSPKFWRAMEQLYPDFRSAKCRLKSVKLFNT